VKCIESYFDCPVFKIFYGGQPTKSYIASSFEYPPNTYESSFINVVSEVELGNAMIISDVSIVQSW